MAGIDAPICQDTVFRAASVPCWRMRKSVQNALVAFTGKEAFEASNDLALGPAIGGAACDVVDGVAPQGSWTVV